MSRPVPQPAGELHAKLDQLFSENHAKYEDSPAKLIEDVLTTIERDHKAVFAPLHLVPASHGTLVRARCMVQHRCEQEYYSYSYDAKFGDSVRKTTSLLRDYIENAEIVNERDVVLKTRYCYVLVPVPGATQWFNDEFLESSSEPEPKRVCVDGTEDSKEAELIQKFIAKFADDDCEDLKPNTVVDVYGILSKHNFEADPDNQFSNSNLPSLMNLHVMRYDFITDQVPERKFIKPIDDIRTVKAVLLQKLSAFLGDTSRDFCFANYFLFHLISSTYSRSGADLPICSMPLNVTGVRDETDSKRFIEGLNLLLSKVKLLPLSADYLSNARLNPRQNHSTGELEQGELQLANGTEVVADETNIQNRCQVSGNVEQNLKALNQLLTEQKLAYDFGVYQISFDVDLPFLILSPGISNLFRTPFPIHYFRENASSQGVSDLFGGSDALAMFRIYIQQAKSKVRLVNISEQTSKAIQNNFVEICQRLPAIEDKALLMQKLLIVSRLLAVSEGRDEVLLEDWTKAFDLETSRIEIIKELHKQVPLTAYANSANKENLAAK